MDKLLQQWTCSWTIDQRLLLVEKKSKVFLKGNYSKGGPCCQALLLSNWSQLYITKKALKRLNKKPKKEILG
jgi:hypothetical protein